MISLYLEGLNCASCANKIENKTNNIPEVKEANMNFASKMLHIKFNNTDDKEIVVNKVIEIVKLLEPHVKIIQSKKINRGTLKNSSKDNACDSRSCEIDVGSHKNKDTKGITKYFFSKHRLIVGILLFILVSIFNFGDNIELIIYLITYLLIGWEVVFSALRNIFRGQIFDENFLMFIATIGAFTLGEFTEAVAVMLFYQIGEVFQSFAVDNSRNSIKELINIKANYANKYIDEEIIKVYPEELEVRDQIIVKPGEKIPVDGIVLEGASMVDTSPLTGESVPKKFTVGDNILSGFINENSTLIIEVTKKYEDSAVAKILDLVENASAKKSNTEKFITKFARYYTPIVVFSALALAFLPPILLGNSEFSYWIKRSLIFLVVSCPCALVVSIPLGFFGGIGAASNKGVLIKGGQYLEALYNVDTIVFDKTGTLTQGVFKVVKVKVAEGIDKVRMIEYAATAESLSNHPIGHSIIDYYNAKTEIHLIESFEEIAGKGIKAVYKNLNIAVGNNKLMIKEGIYINDPKVIGTIVHVAVDKKYYGYFIISDEIKKGSYNLVDDLKSLGIKNTIMLTGDRKLVAEQIKNELQIDSVKYELLPGEKVDQFNKIKKSTSKRSKVAFVGDGINDAPVLASSDVGISMGSFGSDAAIEASDIVLMTDEPHKIVDAIKISKKTRKVVTQNIVLALSIKLAVLTMGAFGMANMWQALFADVGVALIAVLNVTRILNKKM